MGNIFFTADTHIGHEKALKYLPGRPFASETDITAHDKWLTDAINEKRNEIRNNN
jgi:calcineurin-like phosphoesterase family protein